MDKMKAAAVDPTFWICLVTSTFLCVGAAQTGHVFDPATVYACLGPLLGWAGGDHAKQLIKGLAPAQATVQVDTETK